MKKSVAANVSSATSAVGWIVVVLVLMQAITGVLLGLLYRPSQAPARWVDGRYATVMTSERVVQMGPFADTVGARGRPVLGPAGPQDIVLSEAASSVAVSIPEAPLGGFIRNIHHTNTGWLYAACLLWFVLLVVGRAYTTGMRIWVVSIFVLILVVASAWSGRILPDDVYAEISRRIVGHQLQEAPFGTFIASVFGISPDDVHLSRTFFMHVLMGAGLVALVWGYRARRGLAYAIAFVVVVSGVSAVVGPELGPLRDAVRGLDGSAHADPWWVVSPLHALVGWFGAELAGYLVIAVVLGLFVLALPRRIR